MTIRSMMLAGAAFAVLAGCSSGTAPPKTEAEKLAMATEIAGLMSDPKMIDQMFDGMATQAVAGIGQVCSAMPADQAGGCQERLTSTQSVITDVMKETMNEAKAMMPDLMKEMGAIMARSYTGEELAAMKDYYSSPEGKSIMEKQPAVMTEYMGTVMERMQPMQMNAVQKMSERMRAVIEPPAPPN